MYNNKYIYIVQLLYEYIQWHFTSLKLYDNLKLRNKIKNKLRKKAKGKNYSKAKFKK